MPIPVIIHALAALAAVVLVALCVAPGEPSPLRRPLALLAVHQFVWSATAVGDVLTGNVAYAWLAAVVTPLFAPLVLDFTLTFVGRRRRLVRWRLAAWALFGLQTLALLTLAAVPGLSLARLITASSVAMLVTSGPVTAVVLWLLVRHLRHAGSASEQQRARTLLVAAGVLAPLLITDLLADAQLPVPRLSTLGSLAFNVLLARLTLGLGLLRQQRSWGVELGQALLVGLLLVTASLSVDSVFRDSLGILPTAVVAAGLGLFVIGWLTWSTAARSREGLKRFASLGRFSAQMAHDLKNPLAAALGASEFVAEALRREQRQELHAMSALVTQQLQRLSTVIDRYQRLSRLEPQLQRLDVTLLVTRVLSLQGFAAGEHITLSTQLCEPAPQVALDGDLLASALENLVKNAIEAMPTGGTLTVSTAMTDDDEPWLRFVVRDTGSGLDARAQEQAFEPFFTTKASGSGLGLAFVREVARAHGGDAELSSREGVGTTVSFWVRAGEPET